MGFDEGLAQRVREILEERPGFSEKRARHYAEESQDGDPSQIQGDQHVVSFTATGVRLVSP